MASVSASLRTGLGALTSFSSVLNEVLGTIDGKVGQLTVSFDDVLEQLTKISDHVERHEERLSMLETSDEQKNLENALSNINSSVDNKLNDATAQFHKEIVSQRTLNKMDMNALRGKISHSMSEALSMLSEAPRNSFMLDPSSTPAQTIEYLVDRVKQLDDLMNAQQTMNTHFNTALNSDEMVQKVYDSLSEAISKLADKNNEVKNENAHLKQQLREFKNVQREHERLIAELHQALVNDSRMDQLKTKIHERKTFVAGLKGTKERTQSTMSEPIRRRPNPDSISEEYDGPPRSSNAGLKPSAMAALQTADEEEDEDVHGAAAASPTSRGVRVTSSASSASSPHRKNKRENSTKSRTTSIPHSIDEDEGDAETADAQEGGKDAKESEAKETKKPRRAKRPSMIKFSGTENDGGSEGAPAEGVAVEQAQAPEEKVDTVDDTVNAEADEGYDENAEDPPGSLTPTDSFFEGSIFSENNSVTDYYYGSDYAKKFLGSLQARQDETESQIEQMKGQFVDRLDELESTVNVFKRLALMIDDLKVGFEGVRQRVESVTGSENIDEKLAQSMISKIKHVKDLWSKVHSEMVFGLDNIPESEKEFIVKKDTRHSEWPLSAAQIEAQERDREQKLFFKLSLELVSVLDASIEDFAPRESLDATLKAVYPTLLKIYDQAEVLLEMDTNARRSTSLDYCFDDIICSDLSTSLKNYVKEAVNASMPILDECIHKISLHKQLKRALELLEQKADKSTLHHADHDIRNLLAHKVDHQEFIAVTTKLASSTEVQRLQAQITDRLSSAGGTAMHGSVIAAGGEGPQLVLTEQPEFISMQERFGALSNKLVDLQQNQGELVSKEEVHEALKAIIGEVKNIRRNCVMLPIFKEGLKLKADAAELERCGH